MILNTFICFLKFCVVRVGIICSTMIALWGLLAVDAYAQIVGFQGAYAPSSWSLVVSGGNGYVDTSSAPVSVRLVGSDLSGGGNKNTDYTALAVLSGAVTFSWTYDTVDSPVWDPFGYVVDGNFIVLTNPSGGKTQSGVVTFNVNSGQRFGFRVNTVDDLIGPGRVVISNFSAGGAGAGEPPTITSHPGSTTISSGSTTILFVTANGTAPLTYQWYQGSAGITTTPVGTNSDSFTTPPLTAPASYWVRVSNSAGQVDSAVATVSISEVAPNFTSAILNPALISGTPFSTTLTASGYPAATFSVQSGSLPPGITLDATTGALTGTPTTLGSFSGLFAAINSQGTDNQAFNFTVNAPPVAPSFTSPALGSTLVTGTPFSATLSVNANPSANFSVQAGALPPGLTLDTSTGVLSGTPVTVGSFSGVFAATNSEGTATQSFNFTVNAPLVAPAFTSADLSPVLVSGSPYSATLTASGNPAASFSVQSGSLPPGLTLDATTGALTGIPSSVGTFGGVFAATNSEGIANQAFNFTVNPPPVAPAFTSGSLSPTLLTGSPYSATLTASGNPTATFSVQAGTLPQGLSLNSTSGAISGTPTTVGVFSGVLAATNSQGTDTQAFSITVNAPLAAPTFTSAALSLTIVTDAPFSASLTASGNPVANFTLQSGALPPGLSFLAASGVIVGTPTTAGTFSGVFAATNSQGTATQSFNLVVQPPPAVAPAFTNSAINSTLVRGMEFAAILAASGNPAATFSVQSGALPSGLFLDANSGAITGSPTAAGTFSGIFAATNAGGTATQTFNIVVNAPLATTAFSSPALSPAILSGIPFSSTLVADGRPSPTFSLQSGALPPGLSLASGTGILSGIPTVAGSFSGVFSASNGLGTATQSFSFTVTTPPSAPVFSSATLSATLITGTPISHTLGASGHPAPSFSLQSGTLPTGLVLNSSTGALTGAPTTPGTFTGVFAATNALGTATQSFTYTVNSPAGTSAFTNAALNATLLTGASFSATLTANGLPAPAFSIQSGSLPPGLTLSAATGFVTGIPTTAGSFSGVFAATNSNGTVTQAFAFTVNAPLAVPAFTSPALQSTLVRGTFTSVTLRASGNPVPSFGVPSGSLPTGMTLDATTGAISGTPTVVGTFSGVFAASNSQGITNQAFSLTVVAPVATSAFTSPALTTALTTGIPFSATLAANGIPAPTFSLQSGALPPGLSLNAGSGAIRGTPTAVGTFAGVFVATNSQGTATQAFSFTVSAPLAAPVFTSVALNTAIFRSSPYSATLTATGNPAATFSVQSGSLPSGLTLSASTGVISGTPTADGSFTGVFAVTNSQGTVTQAFSFTVNPPLAAPVFTSPAVNPTFSIGTPYTATLAASGNPVPTFGVQTGTLPPGLTLNATSGLLNGTPTVGGAFSGVFRASNSQGAATQAFSFTVNSPPAFTSPALSTTLVAGSSYSASLGASGYPAATFSVQSGTLPTGLTLNASTGLISGTPTALGTFAGVIAASNSQGTATQAFSLTVNSAPAFTSPALNTSLVTGTPYSATLTASGNPAATFSVQSGTLPAGVTLNASTGALNGTPTATGTFSGVFAATNSQGTATQAFSFTVNSVPVFSSPALSATLVTGTPYSTTLTASGTPAATFSVQSGSLPPGLSLNASAGALSGTPTSGGMFAGVFAATNSQGSATQAFSVNVESPPAFTSPALSTTLLTGAPFSATLIASGNPAATFSVQSGTLPAGIALNASTGVLSGTPTALGAFSGVFTATNSLGTATQAFSFTISDPLVAPAISAGWLHSLVLKADGTAWATGWNSEGQLGDGTIIDRTVPVQVLARVTAVAAGSTHSLFLKNDGTVWATGSNSYGELGASLSPTRTPIQTLSGVVAIAAGSGFSIFLKPDGTALASGNNFYGQLGNGTNTNSSTPTQALTGVVAIAAGFGHSLFLKSDGTVWASGYNNSGQLGNGSTAHVTTPVEVLSNVVAIAGGREHSLFLKNDGSVWAAGNNGKGQLGNGITESVTTPIQVQTGVVAIAAGASHSLFLKSDGVVWASGYNELGQLGDGTFTDRASPVQVLSDVRTISANHNYSLFITNDGTVLGVGSNAFGGLGNGALEHRATPVPALSSITQVSAGDKHSLFRKSDGTAWATGENTFGQLGSGGTTSRSIPVQVMSGVAAVEAGGSQSLFLKTDGTVWAAGANYEGQLGIGVGTAIASNPVQVMSNVAAISAGITHTLFLKTDGTAWAAGSNSYGEIGNGTTTRVSTPVQVLTGVLAISAGISHSLFLKTDGTVWSTGSNSSGQLGNGGTTNRTTPGQVLSGVIAISAGDFHSLFLKSDGTVWATGNNGTGQLGNGTNTRATTPVPVLSNVTAISAGRYHSLFLKTGGTAWATGWNTYGQLGNSNTITLYSPEHVTSGVASISAGESHSLFGKTDGTVWAVGSHTSGQLGNGFGVPTPMTLGALFTSQAPTNISLSATNVSENNPANATVGYLSATDPNIGDRFTFTLVSGAGSADNAAFSIVGNTLRISLSTDYETQSHYALRIRATDAGGLFFEKAFTFTIRDLMEASPVFTSATLSATLITGTSYSAALTASGNPTATFSVQSGALPSGLTLDSGTGTLSGTPTVAGTFSGVFRASNSQGDALQAFNFIVNAALVGARFTSTPLNATLVIGTPYSAALTASGNPAATFSVQSGALPPGLSINASSGILSGTPTATGSSVGIFAAANSEGVDTQSFNFTVESDVQVIAWGVNTSGQLGDGTVTNRSTPQTIDTSGALAGKTITSVIPGTSHSIALDTDGNLYAWGFNSSGQLGDGTNTMRRLPVAVLTTGVLAGKTITTAAVGVQHTVALSSDGTLYSWGSNAFGQLGDGTTVTTRTSAVAVNMTGALQGKTIIAVAAGESHSVALASDGTLYAWGQNIDGQLGDETQNRRLSPVAVKRTGALSGKFITAIAAGQNHTLALASDGTIFSWGTNSNGQLGNILSGGDDAAYEPIAVTRTGALSDKTITKIFASGWYSMALASDGTAYAWGYNLQGQLGDGTMTNRMTPVAVSPVGALAGKTLVSISAGFGHAIALSADGGLYAWGSNNFGELGTSTASSTLPVEVTPSGALIGKKITAVYAGSQFSVAIGSASHSGFTAWNSNSFTPSQLLDQAISGPNADPDADGIPNLLEYALDTQPLSSGSSPQLNPVLASGRMSLTFNRMRSELTYVVEGSSDLTTWTTVATNPGTVGAAATVQDTVTLSPTTPRRFLRLKVTTP